MNSSDLRTCLELSRSRRSTGLSNTLIPNRLFSSSIRSASRGQGGQVGSSWPRIFFGIAKGTTSLGLGSEVGCHRWRTWPYGGCPGWLRCRRSELCRLQRGIWTPSRSRAFWILNSLLSSVWRRSQGSYGRIHHLPWGQIASTSCSMIPHLPLLAEVFIIVQFSLLKIMAFVGNYSSLLLASCERSSTSAAFCSGLRGSTRLLLSTSLRPLLAYSGTGLFEQGTSGHETECSWCFVYRHASQFCPSLCRRAWDLRGSDRALTCSTFQSSYG